MLIKTWILSLLFSMCANVLFAQKEMDCLFTKIHLNNLLDSTLKTGLYKVKGGNYITDEEKTYNINYKQQIDTVIIIERFMCFKRKKKAMLVKNKSIVTESYIKKAFERKILPSMDLFFQIDPKPLVLSNNINLINFKAIEDSSFILHLEIDQYGKSNIEKIYQDNRNCSIGLIINDHLIQLADRSSMKIYNDTLYLDLKFTNYTKESMNKIEEELNNKN